MRADVDPETDRQLASIRRVLFTLIFVTSAVILLTQQWHLLPHGITVACLCFTLPAYFIGDLKRRTEEINKRAFENKKGDKKDGKNIFVSSLAFMWASFIMIGVWLAAKAVRAVGCSLGGAVLLVTGVRSIMGDSEKEGIPYTLAVLCSALGVMHIVGVLVLLKRNAKIVSSGW